MSEQMVDEIITPSAEETEPVEYLTVLTTIRMIVPKSSMKMFDMDERPNEVRWTMKDHMVKFIMMDPDMIAAGAQITDVR